MGGKAGVKEDSELGIWVGENVGGSKHGICSLALQGERLSEHSIVKDREGVIASMRGSSQQEGLLWLQFIPVTGGRTTDTASVLTGWNKVMSVPRHSPLLVNNITS